MYYKIKNVNYNAIFIIYIIKEQLWKHWFVNKFINLNNFFFFLNEHNTSNLIINLGKNAFSRHLFNLFSPHEPTKTKIYTFFLLSVKLFTIAFNIFIVKSRNILRQTLVMEYTMSSAKRKKAVLLLSTSIRL